MGRGDRFATQRYKQQAGIRARALRVETRCRRRHRDTIWQRKSDRVATPTAGASSEPRRRRFSLCEAGRSRPAALSPEPHTLRIRSGHAMTTMPVKSIRVYVLTAFLFSFGSATARQPGIERRIDSLLTLMTLEEKCGQLCQVNAAWTKERGPYLGDEDAAALRKGLVGSVLNLYGAKAVAEAERIAVTESRLRIPLLMGLDVIHGYRTIFPVPIAEASTWDPRLRDLSAHTAASEASAAGIQWTFAPMVDIARDPRWGRIVEGSGEDPYLGSVMACAKHFAAYGAAEGGRDYNVADISERTLREIYLPPFHAAVEAGAGSLMSSFNEISGVPSSANRFILTDILRHEWNFDGFVVSDWTAIEELQPHGVAASRSDAGALAVNAGVDMDMVSGIYQKELPALVREGRVRIETVNEAVRRVLRAKFRLGPFSHATPRATT